MPELPDLEVFSQNLTQKLKGKKLQQLHISKNAKTDPGAAELTEAVKDQVIKEVYREGKELRFVFSNKRVLGIHLMLRGKFFWYGDKNVHAHTLIEFVFSGNNNLALTDYQANAKVTLDPSISEVPDARSKAINEKFLLSLLESKASIKNILLDQHRIRGIGNAYADEILWDAGISPFSNGNKIPAAAVKALAKSIHTVLKDAVEKIRNAEPSIIGGEIRDFLLIHNSEKKKSPSGAAIKKQMAGGRPTYYTEEQQLYK